jgi:hypothetical protein
VEEIKKYADLLSLLETSGEPDASDTVPHQSCSPEEEDDEILEWASLFSKANAGVMQKARLRLCSAGLLAVHRHIASNPHVGG